MSVLKRTITRWTQSFSPDKKFSVSTKKVIGNYSYLQSDLIGEGFSAHVYKGKNSITQQTVAIKAINTKNFKKEQIHLSMLQSEIEILKSVANQPNILHLYDTYTTKNNIYIITECCQTDLGKILKAKGKFLLKEAIDIISQVLSGYLHLSQSGFIHRDLKPANIFYQNGVYMIGDFGFAVIARTIKSTNNEYNVGSPLYMAPESLQNNKYNFSTDMWSIGVILYEMIQGKTPWYAQDENSLYDKITSKPISKMVYDIPIECKDFIQRCLSLDAKERLSPTEALEWLNYFIELVEKSETELSPPQLKQTRPEEMVNQRRNNMSREIVHHRSASVNLNLRKRPRSPFQIKTNKTVVGDHINEPNTPTIVDKPTQFKVRTLYYYCKFIQRILLILTSPLKFQFSSSEALERYLINLLSDKINKLYGLSPSNNWCKFSKIEQYFKNPNKQLTKAINRAYFKYKQMYQPDNKQPTIELALVQKSIHELKRYLETEFDDKSILLMDYLTTLYQLFRLEQRYDVNKFSCISKLETIMERNPAEISKEHLERLSSKIIILGI